MELRYRIILAASWAVLCLVFAGLLLNCEKNKKWGGALLCKTLASLFFVLIGMVPFIRQTRSAEMPTALYNNIIDFVFIGLVCGAVGDFLLNLRNNVKKSMPVFALGILVFMAGHVMYLLALLKVNQYVWQSLVLAAVIAAILIAIIIPKAQASAGFKIFGAVYIALVVTMMCMAFGAMLTRKFGLDTVLFFIGSVLFTVSDVVLILNSFCGPSKHSLRITNIYLYYLGQLTIAAYLWVIWSFIDKLA